MDEVFGKGTVGPPARGWWVGVAGPGELPLPLPTLVILLSYPGGSNTEMRLTSGIAPHRFVFLDPLPGDAGRHGFINGVLGVPVHHAVAVGPGIQHAAARAVCGGVVASAIAVQVGTDLVDLYGVLATEVGVAVPAAQPVGGGAGVEPTGRPGAPSARCGASRRLGCRAPLATAADRSLSVISATTLQPIRAAVRPLILCWSSTPWASLVVSAEMRAYEITGINCGQSWPIGVAPAPEVD